MRKTRIYAERSHYTGKIGIGIFATDPREPETIWFADPLAFKPNAFNVSAPQYPLEIERDAAQDLMDQLWSIGIRPGGIETGNGALDATRAHLKDMQTIAFDLLRKSPQPAQG